MAEIDDAQLEMLNRYAGLLNRLNADPKAKRHLESALKAVDPSIRTEADIADEYAAPVRDKLTGLEAKFDTFLADEQARRTEAAERDADATMQAKIDRLKNDGYTDEGLSKIVDIMKTRSIGDPEAAAALFDKLNPPPPVAASEFAPAGWNYENNAGPDVKALFENEERWADETAANVLNEMRRGNNS